MNIGKVKRSATFVATLVYMDEPQLIHLISTTVPVVALAIPSNDASQALFGAVTSTRDDWERYLEGECDLRYLFTYPKALMPYWFDLNRIKNGRVTMTPYEAGFPEEFLPPARFFSSAHTEDFELLAQPVNSEKLLVDGEWQLQEFGRFYQRYSDLYAFSVAQKNYRSVNVADAVREKIREAFRGRPFQGGSSYLHLFNDLFAGLARNERIGLNQVEYASPGFVDVNGRADAFEEVNNSVASFLEHHIGLQEMYSKLHGYLSERGYLKMAGHQFADNDPSRDFIASSAREMADALPPIAFDTVLSLSNGNALVAAKVVLSYYRRLEEAASYFAQGRVAFE
ncbi:MAG: hypothetical protein P4M09_26530 [Devosia sp.]|nr:hypothetical protein [Devosia sp.]